MNTTIENKLIKLKKNIKQYSKAAIGYSGGVDSTFLLKIAKDILGKQLIAITIQTPAHTIKEINEAKKIAYNLKVEHILIKWDSTQLHEFTRNNINRCYYCKKKIYQIIKKTAQKKKISTVLDASTYDDIHEHRPGLQALHELNIHTPLIEVKLKKNEIRQLSKKLNLPTWNKPSNACLATRIPYGTTINKPTLKIVQKAESILQSYNIQHSRVRIHGNIARIEVDQHDFPIIIKNASHIIQQLKKIGFTYITLDIEGFRSGSMNEVTNI